MLTKKLTRAVINLKNSLLHKKQKAPFDVYKRSNDGVYIIDCSKMLEISMKIPIIIYDENCKV